MQPLLPASILLLTTTAAAYLVPNPPGKYNVTLHIGTLADYTRDDSNTTDQAPRTLMLSVFQPATCTSTAPTEYMPEKTAEYQGPYLQGLFNFSTDLSPFFLQARLPVCPDLSNNCSPLNDPPILLFSPGWAIPRLYYSVIASAIASEGFMVITIDHPDDANIITYPDGHSIYHQGPSNPTPEDFNDYTWPRAADASFIIDQLSNATAMASLFPRRGARPFPTDRVAMLGHSLGGVASVVAAGRDPRIRAAIDWDGTIFAPLPASGISQPVMYVSEANVTDPTWVAAWTKLNGPKLWLEVADTKHMSFSDALMLLDAAGQAPADLMEQLGSIEAAELLRILAVYTTEWMNAAFAGKIGGPLLEGLEPGRFPGVEIKRKDNY
ncbi:hypothetical protein BU24DRAFT_164724 [Aaosphaeria arxii CBS 175.79]|uniref:1-alkyl-2-acetylglycerophosphocholine esterase n=1 Tax=Aaosphaeria arxii CBS 175.79 TaxID=1450172 RepID=A0A6A5XZE9_9PLEO|nr:uncharacterized protein BU24DRAFT_164724 [Aaosphaeria arxii CBS 175.79]KAF2018091.1 hypothetical protein BU24DRAFT_164724 [Aaosphaeria arxii CBS 175.79]